MLAKLDSRIYLQGNFNRITATTMFDKILAALREKYKNKGFSEKVLSSMAKKLEKTVTEEGAIAGAIDEQEEMLTVFQSEIDTRVNAAVAKAKADAAPKKEGDPAPPADPPAPPVEVPAWAKGFVDTLKTISDKVIAIEQGTSTNTRKAQLEATLKDSSDGFKNLTLKAFGRMNFKDDEEFTAYLEEVKTDAGTFAQTEADKGLGGLARPIIPTGPAAKTASKAEADQLVNNIM